METYLIRRNVPGIGKLSPEELSAMAAQSKSIIAEHFADRLVWLHSYVAEDALFCVYRADSEESIREHARCGGFDVSEITLIKTVARP